MRVAFVYACISRFGFGTWGGKNFDSTCISHGLAQLSACIKEAGFEDVVLIDLRQCKDWKDYEDKVRDYNPDVLCSTMMSPDYNYVVEAFRIAKEVKPEIVTLVGGPHVSAAPDEIRDTPEIDVGIMGEGEITIVDILKDIGKGRKLEKIYHGKPVEDLDKLPYEDRDLFHYGESVKHPYFVFFEPPMVDILTARGCSYNCAFCQPLEKDMFGKRVKWRGVDSVIEELKMMRDKYHFKSLMIHTDNLLENEEWVTQFCKKYRENGFTQPFYCQGRANLICGKEHLIKMLREAGLEIISIGIESASQRVLNFFRKGTKVEQNRKAIEICKKYGLRVNAQFILGAPTVTREEEKDTMDFIRWARKEMGGLIHCGLNIYTPYPGSDLYQYCEDNDLILIKSHDQYRRDGFTVKDPKIKGVDYVCLQRFIDGEVNIVRKTIEVLRRNRLFHFFEAAVLSIKPIRRFAKYLYTRGIL